MKFAYLLNKTRGIYAPKVIIMISVWPRTPSGKVHVSSTRMVILVPRNVSMHEHFSDYSDDSLKLRTHLSQWSMNRCAISQLFCRLVHIFWDRGSTARRCHPQQSGWKDDAYFRLDHGTCCNADTLRRQAGGGSMDVQSDKSWMEQFHTTALVLTQHSPPFCLQHHVR